MEKGENVIARLGRPAAVKPATATVDVLTALVSPGDVFHHPREVLNHPALSYGEKRAILASWASDAHAVESAPALRSLSGSQADTVPVDEVLYALTELDGGESWQPVKAPGKPHDRRRRRPSFWDLRKTLRSRRRDDDDDDPPPSPAVALPRPRPPLPATGAVAALA